MARDSFGKQHPAFMTPVTPSRFNIIIPQPVRRPSFSLLERCYTDYYNGYHTPCGRADNQCAVRMSLALGRCGFGLKRFPRRDRIHRGSCGLHVQHVLGAGELEKYLRNRLGVKEDYRHTTEAKHQGIFDELSGLKGIIYFKDIDGTTDHIDVFDGWKCQNEVIFKAHQKPDERITMSYFRRAKRISFIELA